MEYADDVRRFNLIGGFVLGALVGAGLGLIGAPLRTKRTPRHIRNAAARAGATARGGARQLREQVDRARSTTGVRRTRRSPTRGR